MRHWEAGRPAERMEKGVRRVAVEARAEHAAAIVAVAERTRPGSCV